MTPPLAHLYLGLAAPAIFGEKNTWKVFRKSWRSRGAEDVVGRKKVHDRLGTANDIVHQ